MTAQGRYTSPITRPQLKFNHTDGGLIMCTYNFLGSLWHDENDGLWPSVNQIRNGILQEAVFILEDQEKLQRESKFRLTEEQLEEAK